MFKRNVCKNLVLGGCRGVLWNSKGMMTFARPARFPDGI